MEREPKDQTADAERFWRAGSTHDAGKLLFERVPEDRRPRWACRILQLVVDRTEIHQPIIEDLLEIGKNPHLWSQGRQSVVLLRKVRRPLEEMENKTKADELYYRVVCFAEIVARVIYNAANPPDHFDSNTGWWVAVCLKPVLDFLGDSAFSEIAWRALCAQE